MNFHLIHDPIVQVYVALIGAILLFSGLTLLFLRFVMKKQLRTV